MCDPLPSEYILSQRRRVWRKHLLSMKQDLRKCHLDTRAEDLCLHTELGIWDIGLTWGRRTEVSEGGGRGRRPGLNRHASDQRMQLNSFCNWMPQTQALHPPRVTFWSDSGCKRKQEAVLMWKDWHEMLCFHSETWCEDLVLMAWLSWSC